MNFQGQVNLARQAVLNSLSRLTRASATIAMPNSKEIDISPLVEIEIDKNASGAGACGSDLIKWRVRDVTAELFGFGTWTRVLRRVMKYDGVSGWLARFYVSHSKSLPLRARRVLDRCLGM